MSERVPATRNMPIRELPKSEPTASGGTLNRSCSSTGCKTAPDRLRARDRAPPEAMSWSSSAREMLVVDGCRGCSADCAVLRRLRSLNQRANSAVGSSSSSSLQLPSRSEIRLPPASGARPPPVRAVVALRSRPPALGSGGASEDFGPGLTSCCTSSASRQPEMAWRRCRLISAVGRPGSSALPAGPGAPGPEGPCPDWEGGLTHSSGRLGGGGAAPNIGPRRRAVCAREASRRGRAGCVGRRPRVTVAERGRPTVRRGWPGSSPGATISCYGLVAGASTSIPGWFGV